MENDAHFLKAFIFFDKDGSGFIELHELQEALTDESGEIDADVLNEIMREVDTNKVDFWVLPLFVISNLEPLLSLWFPFQKIASKTITVKMIQLQIIVDLSKIYLKLVYPIFEDLNWLNFKND